MVTENYKAIDQRVCEAATRAGRRREDIVLIAVSKTKPVSEIMEVYDAGQRVFGENRVQEMCEKIPAMPEDIQWHLIGHLQQNKVKYLMPRTAMIHSVDSAPRADDLERSGEARDRNAGSG